MDDELDVNFNDLKQNQEFQPDAIPNKREAAGDNAETPKWLLDLIRTNWGCNFDPCPKNYLHNGLEIEWRGISFVHPPYSDCQSWLEKAALEAGKGHFSVCLVPFAANAAYWRETVYPNASQIHIFTCPIKLINQKKQTTSQMCLVIFASRHGNGTGEPDLKLLEPSGWEEHYYQRKRNKSRWSVQARLRQ